MRTKVGREAAKRLRNRLDNELIDIDFRFHEIKYELWALDDYIKTFERHLPLIGQHEVDRTWQNLRRDNLIDDEGERSIAFQEVADRIDNIVPRFFRGPILVSLWAIYQSAAEDIGKYICMKKGCTLSLRDIYAGSDFDRLQKYFERVLDFPLIVDPIAAERLKAVITLRNALSHGNGRLSAVKDDKKRKEIEKMESIGVSTSYTEALLFSEEFIRETYDLTAGSLRDLIDRVTSDF